jgi:hypothetical protein
MLLHRERKFWQRHRELFIACIAVSAAAGIFHLLRKFPYATAQSKKHHVFSFGKFGKVALLAYVPGSRRDFPPNLVPLGNPGLLTTPFIFYQGLRPA